MNPLIELSRHGQSYWLDNLTRKMIVNGELARRVAEAGLRGVTSNPAIFNKAISDSPDYDAQISTTAANHQSVPAIYEELVTTDVRDACDILRTVYDESEGKDGYVSLEVSPHLAHHAQASIAEARRLWNSVDRPNLLIKIPGTAESLPAIEELLTEGINVNITLLFSVDRYQVVAETYLRALERRAQEGKPLGNIASVASFFLSRIDTLVDDLLRHRITEQAPHESAIAQDLMGKAAIANAKLAYRRFTEMMESGRWRSLEEKGASPQRLLWASTSTKNPKYSDVMYVEPLVGPETVNTMPERTIDAFADHGSVKDTLTEGVDAARKVMADLAEIGINIEMVAEQLLNEGVQKFIDPYDALSHILEKKSRVLENHSQAAPLKSLAAKLRREVIRMTTAAGSGHPTSCMSCAELVAALFFHEMRWDPTSPKARDVDTFILSKGHAAPILWAALHEANATQEDPLRLRKIDSSFEGHPTPTNPWIKVATGSLGQGLSAANGIAMANRLDGLDARVYCLLGDGECSEGSVWEAAQFAALTKLSGLVAIVDVNALGQSGPTPYGHHTSVFAERFKAFGWHTVEIDGHDMQAVLGALAEARDWGPTAILARTEKGKGVSFLEGKDGWHGKALNEEQMEKALQELPEADISLPVQARHAGPYEPKTIGQPNPIAVAYDRGDQVATRSAYGHALRKLGTEHPHIVVLDGDVKNSTHTAEFAQQYPGRFIEDYISEQNMAGVALGLAACGKIPYATTFASFLSRAYDFIRMAGHSRPGHLVFCGSHAGVSIGEDGPSQMGLEDIAMFRAVNGSTVLYPCDAVSSERLTEQAALTHGIVYIRTTRPKTPVIYYSSEQFRVGGSKTLRRSDTDKLTVVAAGITVHEALAAYEKLHQRGITIRVIDAYSIKPLDKGTIAAAARDTQAVVTVEDHWAEGGLGDVVETAVGTLAPVYRLAVYDEPRSGTQEELLERHGISRNAIERRILEIAGQMGMVAA
ncbi:MAG: transketolase [Gammaproteobacteria bacterium]|jgi:transketolase